MINDIIAQIKIAKIPFMLISIKSRLFHSFIEKKDIIKNTAKKSKNNYFFFHYLIPM